MLYTQGVNPRAAIPAATDTMFCSATPQLMKRLPSPSRAGSSALNPRSPDKTTTRSSARARSIRAVTNSLRIVALDFLQHLPVKLRRHRQVVAIDGVFELRAVALSGMADENERTIGV